MGKRRRGREFALKILYRLDLTGEDWESVREEDLDDYDKTDAVHSFGVALIEAVLGHRESLDEALSSAADNWEIGRMAKVGFNVDTFGHCATLPQILRKSGLNYYVFMRPDPREKTLPSHLFWWQSPDGSRVLTNRIDSYNANDLDDLDRKFKRAVSRSRASGFDALCFYGRGDHGGGPAEDLVIRIEELRGEIQEVDVIFSTPDDFFEVLSTLSPQLPIVEDELQPGAKATNADAIYCPAFISVRQSKRLLFHLRV